MSSDSDEVTVLEIHDPVQQSLIESVLTDAEVPYNLKHVGLPFMTGVGQVGSSEFVSGQVVLQVRAADADRARELIAEALDVPELPAED